MSQRRGVLNHFLKSAEQKKKDLVKGSMAVPRKRKPSEFASETKDLPNSLSSSLQTLVENMDEVCDGINQNIPILTEHLDTLNEQQLKALVKIFDPKRKVSCTEGRLVDASFFFQFRH